MKVPIATFFLGLLGLFFLGPFTPLTFLNYIWLPIGAVYALWVVFKTENNLEKISSGILAILNLGLLYVTHQTLQLGSFGI